jgi:hypothetical protein
MVYGPNLIVARENNSVEAYDMQNQFLCTNTFEAKHITCLCVSQDALGCDVLLVGQKDGYMDMYNISSGFKRFTQMMAYANSPVNKAVTYMDMFGLGKGMLTVGNDG